MKNKNHIISAKGLSFTHLNGNSYRFPDFALSENENLLVFGSEKSGKTTFIHLLSGILRIQSGTVRINKSRIGRFSEKKMDEFRGRHIGMISQHPIFIRAMNILDNMMAAQFFALGKSDKKKAIELLDGLDLLSEMKRSPVDLSPAVLRRVAIVRAFVSTPKIVLADQPTVGLDLDQASKICDFLLSETSKIGSALIVTTHDERLKSKFSKTIDL